LLAFRFIYSSQPRFSNSKWTVSVVFIHSSFTGACLWMRQPFRICVICLSHHIKSSTRISHFAHSF
jgi:hypothetical protein